MQWSRAGLPAARATRVAARPRGRLPAAVAAFLAVLAALAVLVGCGVIDLSPFTVSTWPSASGEVLDTADNIWVEFSEPVQKDVVKPMLSVTAGGQNLDGDLSWNGDRLVFTPATRFAPGVRHVLQFQGTVRTTAGRSFDEIVIVPFYVGTDSQPPIVTATTPPSGAVVSVGTPLVLAFSEPIDAASFRDSFSVSPVTGFTVSWDTTATVATVAPASRWSAQSLYTWSIATACASSEGVPVARAWSGTFLVQSDTTSPAIASVVPATLSGATVLPQGTSLSDLTSGECIEMTFSEDVDLAALTSAFSLSPAVAGTIRKVSAGVFLFVPSESWTMAQEYLLAISTELEDLSGNPLPAPHREIFTPKILAQAVTAIDVEGNLQGSLPLAAPLNSTAPFMLPWVPSGSLPDSEMVLRVTIHFAEPYDPVFQPVVAGAVRCAGFFPASTTSPQVLFANWLDTRTLRISYIGFHRSANSPSRERLYYKLTVPGGRDQTQNQAGSFMTDPVSVLLESGSDS